jgi:hypothetical protein
MLKHPRSRVSAEQYTMQLLHSKHVQQQQATVCLNKHCAAACCTCCKLGAASQGLKYIQFYTHQTQLMRAARYGTHACDTAVQQIKKHRPRVHLAQHNTASFRGSEKHVYVPSKHLHASRAPLPDKQWCKLHTPTATAISYVQLLLLRHLQATTPRSLHCAALNSVFAATRTQRYTPNSSMPCSTC